MFPEKGHPQNQKARSGNDAALLRYSWLFFLVRHCEPFGFIPKDTDNPDYKRILAERAEKKHEEELITSEREKMEVYYRKYAPDFKYAFRRSIADRKFKRKKRKEAKKNPRPPVPYTPPKRTAEEQAAITRRMKALYKEYHVSWIEHLKRKLKAMTKEEKERQLKQALGES